MLPLFGVMAVSAMAAPPAYESFETAVPDHWKATGRGALAISAERYKSGERSLAWNWASKEDCLEFGDAAKFSNKSANQGFALWVYNETPHATPMRAELLRGGQVVASVWFWMDYRGWRPLGVSYSDAGVPTGQGVDGIRLHAPQGLAKGKLFVDCASFDASGMGRHVTSSYQMPWVGDPDARGAEPASAALSSARITQNRPWLPALKKASAITESEREDLAKLSQRLLPPLDRPGKGVKPEVLESLRQRMAEYRIKRENGRITGRPIDSGSMLKPDDAIRFHDYLKTCGEVQRAYEQASEPQQREELERMFVDLSAHYLDQGWAEGSRLRAFDNYPSGASGQCFLRMRDVLEKAGLAREIGLAMAWTLGCHDEGNYLHRSPFASMDGVGFWANELLPFLLMLPDEADRLQHVLAAKRAYDMILVNPDTIGPDGCSYHHGMFHFAYASYNLPRLIRVLQKMADTQFRLSEDAHKRLKAYAHAIAFTLSAGEQPYNLGARAGMPLRGDMAGLAELLAPLGSPDGRQPVDDDMIRLAITQYREQGQKGEAKLKTEPFASWIAKHGEPESLSGNLCLNGSPLAVHRRPGFLVGIAGMSKFWRGLEIYGWTESNNYGRFARNGSVCVVSGGKPPSLAESGWNLEGWNWCHFPGTTALLLPPADVFDGYAMYGNGSAFAGGTELDGNGAWAMDYTGGNGVSFRKSVFSFANRLTVVTSGIKSGRSDAPAITTMFQNQLRSGHDSVQLDDGSSMALPSSKNLAGSKVRWLIDNQNVGYHIPADQPPLELACRSQQWIYMVKKYLKDPKDNPFPSNSEYRYWSRKGKDMAALESKYRPSTGDFAVGWFNHGAKPTDAGCAYTMVINATPQIMREFAAKPSYEILSSDSHHHVVCDQPSGTTAYALFDANDAIAVKGPLKSNDQPCFVMVCPQSNGLKLSVACTDIERKKPVVLTLDGSWKAVGEDSKVRCRVANGVTTLELLPESYMPLRFTLSAVK